MQSASRVWPRIAPRSRESGQPLTVVFIITSMPVGGAEVLLKNLIDGFDPRRIAPEIICLKEPGPLGEAIAAKWPVHARLLRSKYDVRVLPRLIRLLRRRRTAAIVTVGAGDKMFWGRLAGWIAGVPTILSALHSTGWPDGVGRANRLLTPITDGFIAVADSHAEYLRRVERFPAARVHAIRNGVDTDRFTPDPTARDAIRRELRTPADVPLLGIVAALRPEKNHAMFLNVAARLVNDGSDAHFVIVGDGPERGSIERQRDELGLQGRVHLLGTRHDTPAILASLDAFLLCSHNEASPVSILEALACQVPVIATDVGSVSESVIPGETGFLVAVNDEAAMADAALALARDRELACRLGRHGRERVIEQGSLPAMVRGYTHLVETLYDSRATGNRRQLGVEPHTHHPPACESVGLSSPARAQR